MKTIILTCVVSFFIKQSYQAMLLGKADLEITSVELCPGSESDKYTITIERHKIDRKTEAWSGATEFDRDLGAGVTISIMASTRVDGGYKESYQMNDSNACEFLMKHLERKFTELLITAQIPPKCPIPPGSYVVDKFVVDTNSIDIDLIYGEYRVDAVLYQDGGRVFCVRIYCTAKPKNSMMGG